MTLIKILMGRTLWFWVIILFIAIYQPMAKIRTRIHPHSLLELRLVGFTQADTMEQDIETIAAEDPLYKLNQSSYQAYPKPGLILNPNFYR